MKPPDTQHDLLRAIVAEPNDDAPSLVYADWLEEHGDPLASLLRVQLRLSATPSWHRDRIQLEAEHAALLAQCNDFRERLDAPEARANQVDWTYEIYRGLVTLYVHELPPVGPLPCPPPEWFARYRRYFVAVKPPKSFSWESWRVDAEGLAALLDSDLMRGCVGLRMEYCPLDDQAMRCLARSSATEEFIRLDLSNNRFSIAGMATLAQSPFLGGLLELNLARNRLGDTGVEALAASGLGDLAVLNLGYISAGPGAITALARSTSLTRLRKLNLNDSRFDPPAARAMAQSHAFAELHDLSLNGCRIDDASAMALIEGDGLSGLRRLDLSWSKMGHSATARFVQAWPFPNLCQLDLGPGNGLQTVQALTKKGQLLRCGMLDLSGVPREAAEVIANSPHCALLERLHLSHSKLTDEDAERLARSPYLKGLRRLDLSFSSIGSAGAALLAAPDAFPALECLSLANSPIGGVGALALAQWRHERGMNLLDLTNCGVNTEDVAALVASGWLVGLRTLKLATNPIGDEGVRLLANSPALAGLRMLDLSWVGLTEAGAQALVESPHLDAGLHLTVNNWPLASNAIVELTKRFAHVEADNVY